MAILTHVRRLLGVALVLGAVAVPVMAQGFDEYDVKAAFLFNFARFVDWPATPELSNLAICILGDDPFGSTLDRIVEGKTVKGRTLVVRRVQEPQQAAACQIVFVRASERARATKLMNTVRHSPVLTVGENFAFTDMGGVAYLAMESDRVSAVVNLDAIRANGLRISAKLLSVVRLVRDGEEAK